MIMYFKLTQLRHRPSSLSRYNTELNDLRKVICLRKSYVFVERITVCNVIENLAEIGIHCLSSSCTNDVIKMLPQQI